MMYCIFLFIFIYCYTFFMQVNCYCYIVNGGAVLFGAETEFRKWAGIILVCRSLGGMRW